MAVTKKRINFTESDEGVRTRQILIDMALDMSYNTESSYSANADRYPDHVIPFVDKHMNYLTAHPSTDPRHYLANLRLMSRVRR